MTEKTMIFSVQQNTIFDWVENGFGNAIVIAVAGAGKTTTLVEAIKRMGDSRVALCAYNRKIADELKAKVFGQGRFVGTFHSFGFSAWRQVAKNVQVDDKKMWNILETEEFSKVPEIMHGFVVKLVGLAKNQAIGVLQSIADRDAWFDIVDHFDLDMELCQNGEVPENLEQLVSQGITVAQMALQASIKMALDVIDYDDMLYMPLQGKVKMWTYDWVLIDEAQDTNPARRCLAKKMLKPGGRLIAVGDPYQAIYGFTGADNDSLDIIKKEFNAKELPLTITYRCPKAVVRFVQQWVNHIEAADEAPEGTRSFVAMEDLQLESTFRPTDAVLCRNTKPLVELAYKLIAKRVPCHVEGREIGKGLVALAGRWKKIVNVRILAEKLEEYRQTQTQKLMSQGKELSAAGLNDKIDTLQIIINTLPQGSSVNDLKREIEKLFADDAQNLTLSTIHKSKGREWDRVYWLGRNRYQPSPFARQAWQEDQERNLMYVAGTRAKQDLIEIGVPKPSKH